jgi:hypothetical protein
MKKALIHIIAPVALSILGLTSAQAAEQSLAELHAQYGISAEPDEEGYYIIYRPKCGTTLGTVSSEGLKYKLARSITCPASVDEVGPDYGYNAFTVEGHNTEFNLNGKIINCNSGDNPGYEFNFYSIGVQMAGDHGKLLGSSKEHKTGKIINCYNYGVLLSGLQEGKVSSIEDGGNIHVKQVKVEDSYIGFVVLNNGNTLEGNIAATSDVGFGLNYPGFENVPPPAPYYLYGNEFTGNIARDNTNGFYDRNNVAPSRHGMTVNSDDELDNVFIDNEAEFNSADGFLIIGAGGKYLYNYANQNGGDGFQYDFYHDYTSPPNPALILAKFEGNEAFNNDYNGFEANIKTNGAYFKNNIALLNNQLEEGSSDLSDDNNACASDDAELYSLNRWIRNFAFTAEPNCTRGGGIVVERAE